MHSKWISLRADGGYQVMFADLAFRSFMVKTSDGSRSGRWNADTGAIEYDLSKWTCHQQEDAEALSVAKAFIERRLA